ncbi:MAG: S8 family serine peptidase [Saprospiraceae bacterium]|nr:S8 family serine peptidase [Saprospiraceae bacterium]
MLVISSQVHSQETDAYLAKYALSGAEVWSASDSSAHPTMAQPYFLAEWITKPMDRCYKEVRKLGPVHSIITIDGCDDLSKYAKYVMPVNNRWKLSPAVDMQWGKPFHDQRPFLVAVVHPVQFEKYLRTVNILAVQTCTNPPLYSMNLHFDELKDLITLPYVYFVDDRSKRVREERALHDYDLGVNRINLLHSGQPNLKGANQVVSIKESLFDIEDIDFKDRFIDSDISPVAVTTHATNMATMIAGGGNSHHTGKGVAPMAALTTSNFLNLLPDSMNHFDITGAAVQNHSYGLGIENYYGGEAAAYDQQIYANPHLLHVFSAGNHGDSISISGTYQGIPGFANLTGTFKMAKNVLVVGAVDSSSRVVARSSRGPAFDGRIKPDLVAYGQDGSSGAAAIVSGVASLLQEAYKQQHGDQLSNVSLLKAALLNSATDIATEGPDYLSGFGNLDANRSVQTILDERYYLGEVGQDETQQFSIEIPEDALNLKITLAWLDPPAVLNTSKTLVNDIDLVVSEPNNTSWMPWILKTTSHPDSLALPARRGIDRINNQEQVTIAFPTSTMYNISVSTHEISSSGQRFALVYDFTIANQFEWTEPARNSQIVAGENMPVRWNSTFSARSGRIEYKLVNTSDWIFVGEVDIDDLVGNWQIPEVFAQAQLRMLFDSHTVISDTFTISPSPILEIAFNCSDSLLLVWSAIDSAKSYQVLGLTGSYLEPIHVSEDTTTIIRNVKNVKHFAVAPISHSNILGVRSRTINLDFQSVGCYIDNFLADLVEDQVRLQLFLGSRHNVAEVILEKWTNNEAFVQIASFAKTGALHFEFFDDHLLTGGNIYRAVLRLSNGQLVYSEESLIRYSPMEFLLVPNPIARSEGFSIISKTTDIYTIRFYDVLGKLVRTDNLFSRFEILGTEAFLPGVYYYFISANGQNLDEGTIVIL